MSTDIYNNKRRISLESGGEMWKFAWPGDQREVGSNTYTSGNTASPHDFFKDISELHIVKVKVPLFNN